MKRTVREGDDPRWKRTVRREDDPGWKLKKRDVSHVRTVTGGWKDEDGVREGPNRSEDEQRSIEEQK